MDVVEGLVEDRANQLVESELVDEVSFLEFLARNLDGLSLDPILGAIEVAEGQLRVLDIVLEEHNELNGFVFPDRDESLRARQNQGNLLLVELEPEGVDVRGDGILDERPQLFFEHLGFLDYLILSLTLLTRSLDEMIGDAISDSERVKPGVSPVRTLPDESHNLVVVVNLSVGDEKDIFGVVFDAFLLEDELERLVDFRAAHVGLK